MQCEKVVSVLEKDKVRMQGLGAAARNREVTEGLAAKVTCGQNMKRGSGASAMAIWMEVFLAERKDHTRARCRDQAWHAHRSQSWNWAGERRRH